MDKFEQFWNKRGDFIWQIKNSHSIVYLQELRQQIRGMEWHMIRLGGGSEPFRYLYMIIDQRISKLSDKLEIKMEKLSLATRRGISGM